MLFLIVCSSTTHDNDLHCSAQTKIKADGRDQEERGLFARDIGPF